VTDYGCGSGILAIAALKLGAASAIGVDNDPQALTASGDTAQRNGVADRLAVFLPGEEPAQPADVFVANILAGPLGELAPTFAAACKRGAPFAISGILAGQQDELMARYAEWFDDLRVDVREDWVRISGHRR
jgi:ribosomal protein L11 methyltransferase